MHTSTALADMGNFSSLSTSYNISGHHISKSMPDNNTREGGHAIPVDEFFFQQLTANNLAVASITLYGWEWLTTLPFEYRLYRDHKFTSQHVILFVLIRYGSLPALILPAYSVWHDFRNDPRGCRPHQQLTVCFVQLIVAIVLARRCIAIWSPSKRIKVFFAILVPAQFVTSFILLWYSTEAVLPNGACMPMPSANGLDTLPWFYFMAMMYDMIAISLSSYKLWQYGDLALAAPAPPTPCLGSSMEKQQSRLKSGCKRIKRQWSTLTPLIESLLASGIGYVTMAIAFNLTSFILLYLEQLHAHSIIVLYAPLMTSLMQRTILTDVDAIWGRRRQSSDRDGGVGTRQRELVDRIVHNARHSWEASILEAQPSSPERASETTAAAPLCLCQSLNCPGCARNFKSEL